MATIFEAVFKADTAQLKTASQAVDGLAGKVPGLNSRLSQLKDSFSKVSGAISTANDKLQSLAGVMVGVGIVAFARSVISLGSDVSELAAGLDITTQSLLELQAAGLGSGKSLDDTSTMMNKMLISAQGAADGADNLTASYAAVGINAEYLRTHSPDETFRKIVAGLANTENAGQRAALTLDLLGKKAVGTDFKSYSADLAKTAGTMKDAAAAADAAEKTLDKLAATTNAVKIEFLKLLQPALEAFNGIEGGANGAKMAAAALLGVMTLAFGSVVVTSIKTVAGAVTFLTGMFTANAASAAIATAATTGYAASLATFTAGALGRVGTATMAVNVAQIALNGLQVSGTATAIALTGATTALAVAKGRLATAQAAAILTTGGLTAAQAAMIPVTVAANVAATGLLVTMRAIAWPVTAVIVAITALTLAYQKFWGAKNNTEAEQQDIWRGTPDAPPEQAPGSVPATTGSTADMSAEAKAAKAKERLAFAARENASVKDYLAGLTRSTQALGQNEAQLRLTDLVAKSLSITNIKLRASFIVNGEAILIEREAIEAKIKAAKLAGDVAEEEWNDAMKREDERIDRAFTILKDENDYIRALRDKIDPMQAIRVELDKIDDLYNRGRISSDEWGIATMDLNEKMDDLLNGTKKSLEKQDDMWGELTRAVEGYSQKMGDAFVDFAMRGEKSFKGMMSTIFEELARMVANQAFKQLLGGFGKDGGAGTGLIGAVMGMFTAANGAVMNNGSPVTAFAHGGIVGSPTMFPMRGGAGLMGEAGPEAIMPLTRLGSGKLGVQSAGGSSPTINNITTINVTGTDQPKETAEQIRKMMQGVADTRIANSRRSGGMLNPTGAMAF